MRAVIHRLPPDAHHQVSVIVEFYTLRAFDADRDVIGIGAGRDDEIVFERLLRAVKGQIDAGIDFAVFDTGVVRNARMPLVRVIADQVVALGRQQIIPGNPTGAFRSRLRADRLDAQSRGWRMGNGEWVTIRFPLPTPYSPLPTPAIGY